MIVIIDNYDSFTYNLVQGFGEIDPNLPIEVRRNDAVTLDQIAAWRPSHIVISPGPCSPNEAGISNAVVSRFAGEIPLLGVCLGHQCIGQVFGGEIVRATRIMHGKTSPIFHDGQGLYAGLPNPFEAARYHSLLICRDTWTNPDLIIDAWTAENEIMGIRHIDWPLFGVQFHPESFMTAEGVRLLNNFLQTTPALLRA